MRQYHCTSYDDDLIDYPVSEAFWRDAYRRGLTPHRPPNIYEAHNEPEDLDALWTEVQELREQVQVLERTIARLVQLARSRTSQQPSPGARRPDQSAPLRLGGRIHIPRVE